MRKAPTLGQRLKSILGVPTSNEVSFLQMIGLTPGVASGVNDSSYANAMAINAWVFACVSAIASAVGSIPLQVKRKAQGSKDWIVDDGNSLAQLLGYVNSDQDICSIMELTAGWLALNGNAYWQLLRLGTGAPDVVRPLPADRIRPIAGKGNKSNLVSSYQIISSGMPELPDTDVVHFRAFGVDPIVGMPPVRPLEVVINTFSHLSWYKYGLFRNGGIAPALLKVDKVLDDDEREKWSALWASWRGTDNGGKPLIVGEGWDLKAVGIDPDKIAGMEISHEMRETICGGYGVPPAIVSLMQDVNLNTMRVSRRQFWTETIIPRYYRRIIGGINEQLAYQCEKQGESLMVEGDFSQIDALQEDKQEQQKILTGYVAGGILTPNEAREVLGREPHPDGDKLYEPKASAIGGVGANPTDAGAGKAMVPTVTEDDRREDD